MAVSAIKVTLGQSLPGSDFNSVATAGLADPRAKAATSVVSATAADDAVAASQALEAAVSDARAAAAANATIAGDGTALGLVNAIQTAFDLLIAAQVTAKTATAAAKTDATAVSLTGDLIILIDTAVITSRNALQAALKRALLAITGHSILT